MSPRSPAEAYRHTGWARLRGLVHASLWRTSQSNTRIAAFQTCGDHASVYENPEKPGEFRVAGSCCHDRFCMPCARQRGQRIGITVHDKLAGKRFRMATLTIKADGLSLAEAVRKLNHSFQVLRRTNTWKAHVDGGVSFLEITWSESANAWHPHLHCLIEGRYFPHEALKAAWLRITKDSPIVHLKFCEHATNVHRYVTRYVGKPFDSSFVSRPDRLDEMVTASKGLRLITTFGTWRGMPLTPEPIETAWNRVASLDEVVRAAHRHEAWAELIINALERERVDPALAIVPDIECAQRAPPHPVAPDPYLWGPRTVGF